MDIEYTLKRSNRGSNLKVKVEASGEVVVSAHPLVPKFLVNKFVNEARPWIERQLHKVKLKQNVFPVFDWEKQILSFKGKIYSLKFKIQNSKITIVNDNICFYPITGRQEDGEKMLINWLKREGEKIIALKAEEWSKIMGLSFKQLKFRQQKSRWGSCSSSGTITFNWRLIHFNPEVIDYVVIHELAHIKHHDHSQRFWNLVTRYQGDYKRHMNFLNHQVLKPLLVN